MLRDSYARSVLARAALVMAGLTLTVAGQDKTSADQLLARAKSVYSSNGPSDALGEYQKALAAYQAEHNPHGEAITLGLIGNCYKHLGDRGRALDFLARALKMKHELGDRLEEGKTLSNIGLVYWESGDYPKAIDHFNRARGIGREVHDPRLEWSALNNLSLVYDEQGNYRQSLLQYEQVLVLEQAANSESDQADTLGNIGGVYLLLGRFGKAIEYYRQALSLDERLDRGPAQSQDLGNLAICQASLGQLEESVQAFDRALSLAKAGGLKKEAADWEKGRASALLRLGKFDAALQGYSRALASYQRADLKRELVEALRDDGYVHLVLDDHRSADRSYRRAIQVSRQISFARGVVINTLALADADWRSRDFGRAITRANQAIVAARKLDDRVDTVAGLIVLSSALLEIGKSEEALRQANEAVLVGQQGGMKLLQAEALDRQSEILLRLGRASQALQSLTVAGELLAGTGDTILPWHLDYLRGQSLESLKRNEEAVAAYRQSIVSIEGIRGSISEDRFRTGFLEDKQRVYVALVRLLLRMGRAGDAFQYSERLRARGYLELMNHTAGPTSDPRLLELQARIRRLQRAIEDESAKALSEQRGSALSTYSSELADAQREYSDLVGLRPGDGDGRPPISLPEVEQIQKRLPPEKALLEYVVGPRHIAIFVLRHDSLHAVLEPVRSVDLESKVMLMRRLVKQVDSNDWQLPAQSLRKLLLGPVERAGWLSGISEIIIVPQGFLHYLPFSALVRSSSTGNRFLIEDYVISYLPAAAALTMSTVSSAPGERLVALAPSIPNLRFTSSEARAVALTFGQHGTPIIGPGATETWFKTVASDYSVIHFATHGLFNKANPLFSGVQLQPDAQNDGRLEVHEILGLHLRAQLVTLSACETALGGGYFTEIPAGDEFVGLTRAFLSAGASTVVASLWEVNDGSTAELMRKFYGHVSHAPPSPSLAAAQRSMLHGDSEHRHPYYWAAFVSVGMANQ